MKVLLLISIFLSFYSSAETKVVESTLFYEVAPASKGSLLETVNSASPIRENGDVFHGYTKYEINWRFWWKSNNKQCVFTKVETTLKLKYTMPQLRSSKSDVKVVWSNWYPNLEIHEKGHGKLAKDTAYKIDKNLLSLGPKANCNLLEKAGNKLAHKLIGELKKSSKQYDLNTNHGETQNAWLYLHL
ncbi:DUF922 domain-containing protein [Colwellia sp. Arc7-635]|uniref:DUF922 domain-containing Zn-dependent protease n=1 Tax=Colwellia sp. Arc7-635 TaxID=2497879 RepID=UPI0013E057E9|nr:DUF922 domain-containing protein [Colwellia sp. Arc7-635]